MALHPENVVDTENVNQASNLLRIDGPSAFTVCVRTENVNQASNLSRIDRVCAFSVCVRTEKGSHKLQ